MKFKTFCAANSGEGFYSLFHSVIDEKKQKVYYIKGGPGCGKSTLLKQLAEHAETAELIYCSGDPGSLDGVILPEQNAVVIDATAPHSHEPIYPGVGGTIIDLGIGWDSQKMSKTAIIQKSEEKKSIYKNCYALLKGARSIQEGVFSPLEKYLSISKIKLTCDKLLRQNALWEKTDHQPQIAKRFLSGISPDGRITFCDTFLQLGKNIIILEDRWMVSHVILSILEQRLTENGVHHINCYHPLFGSSRLQHLVVPSVNLSIVTRDGLFPLEIPEENVVRKINLQGMMEKSYIEQHKNKLAFIKRIEREILNLATEKLSEARALHLEIEQEYAKGTDFSKTDPLKEKLINNIFSQP